ncbi:hypothetical protein L2E82_25224 [Cichorium intybus]|uniref:Uncharacterized protein n=1 Tax=Cichorium intybus TaxID=13427 RepID=A0ACB9E3F6_CICIN|nr:hypothetical protein L2E82_25224 [Cichorium intybus]
MCIYSPYCLRPCSQWTTVHVKLQRTPDKLQRTSKNSRSSICQVKTLKVLSVTNCESLEELPIDLGKLIFLQILRVYAGPKLKTLSCRIKAFSETRFGIGPLTKAAKRRRRR